MRVRESKKPIDRCYVCKTIITGPRWKIPILALFAMHWRRGCREKYEVRIYGEVKTVKKKRLIIVPAFPFNASPFVAQNILRSKTGVVGKRKGMGAKTRRVQLSFNKRRLEEVRRSILEKYAEGSTRRVLKAKRKPNHSKRRRRSVPATKKI